MGALFSTEPEVRTYQRPYNYQTQQNLYREREYVIRTHTPTPSSYYSSSASASSIRPSTTYSTIQSSVQQYSRPSLYSPNNNYFPSTRVSSSKTTISKADFKKFQQILYSALIRQSRSLNWNISAINVEYQKVFLQPYSNEYIGIHRKFMRNIAEDTNYPIEVTKIERVENPHLMGQYCLKKLEYRNKKLPVEERLLFHGTKIDYIDNICKNNFDWRLHGRTKGNKFGKGVSFTPKSPYANHYCDKNNKVMIVAKVLVSKVCEGNEYMKIPNYYDRNRLLRFDTSIKEPRKDVVVKYSDDEFYPAYLVHYRGKMFYHTKGFSR